MWLLIFGAIALIIGIILTITASKQIKLTKENNQEIKNELNDLYLKKIEIQSDINHSNEVIMTQKMSLQQLEETAKNSFETYHEALENKYQDVDKEYDNLCKKLYETYETYQDHILSLIQEKQDELDKIAATYKAAKEAQLKELEIKEKERFYSLSLDELDLHEVKILRNIESELRDPRPVKMIIWSTYYSKRANDMAARVLGTGTEVTGIYKITNKESGLSYIGQAKNIRERWRDHMKCGLGIDTPANNRLYQDMLKDGIDNFTFELVEKCSSNELDEKESFYIKLYQTKEYGYNSTAGNKK